MKAPDDLPAQMAEKSSGQLLDTFEHPDHWLPEALEAASAELRRRGIDEYAIGLVRKPTDQLTAMIRQPDDCPPEALAAVTNELERRGVNYPKPLSFEQLDPWIIEALNASEAERARLDLEESALDVAQTTSDQLVALIRQRAFRRPRGLELATTELERRGVDLGTLLPWLWKYDGTFHRVIADADRIVFRDGGYDCCRPVDGQKVLTAIVSAEEVGRFRENIQFVRVLAGSMHCMCCGYPGIDWYKAEERLALTSLHHGHLLRWRGFPGDVPLTQESSAWIVSWLKERGIRSK